jgi:hypothetical protein
MIAMEMIIYQKTLKGSSRIENGLGTCVSEILNHTIGNSLNHDQFQAYVASVLELREKELVQARNLCIDVDPRFSRLFRSSRMVASTISSYS